jgi:signal transduction histidine kinase
VSHHTAGVRRAVPATVDLAAYRIIQEGLTNARKHGTGEGAELTVAYRPDGLDIGIRNRIRPGAPPASGTGHGLTGMRERAQSVGGRLSTAVLPGEFRLDAHLPLPEEPQ